MKERNYGLWLSWCTSYLPFQHRKYPGYISDDFSNIGICVALFSYPWPQYPGFILSYYACLITFTMISQLGFFAYFGIKSMSNPDNASQDAQLWSNLELPELVFTDKVREIHARIENKWDNLRRSACQTAAGRALWKHVITDPLAELLAGETYLRSLHEKIQKDYLNNAREVSGVILAVRTLWFDSKIEAALNSFGGKEAQVVLLGAGMDTRAYRLRCLNQTDVFEVDFSEVLEVKSTIIHAATESTKDNQQFLMRAKSLIRVAADIQNPNWLTKLQTAGFMPEKNTVWILEGILYYLTHSHATEVLKTIVEKCADTDTILLADFMNQGSTKLPNSTFHFYSDWPEHLLSSLGYSSVSLSQIGDPDADFGLMNDPLNLFNRMRNLPRSVDTHPDDGTPCRRLYFVQASCSSKRDT